MMVRLGIHAKSIANPGCFFSSYIIRQNNVSLHLPRILSRARVLKFTGDAFKNILQRFYPKGYFFSSMETMAIKNRPEFEKFIRRLESSMNFVPHQLKRGTKQYRTARKTLLI